MAATTVLFNLFEIVGIDADSPIKQDTDGDTTSSFGPQVYKALIFLLVESHADAKRGSGFDGVLREYVGKYSKRRRSNVVVIIVKIIFISSFLFYCLLLNHSFQTNPNSMTNIIFFSVISLLHCSCVAIFISKFNVECYQYFTKSTH